MSRVSPERRQLAPLREHCLYKLSPFSGMVMGAGMLADGSGGKVFRVFTCKEHAGGVRLAPPVGK